MTWKDFSGRKEVTFDWTGVSILRRLRCSLDANAPYQELCGSTGHGQHSIFHPQEGMQRQAGMWRSIIRWRSAYVVPKMGCIPRKTANNQYKRTTKRTSRRKGNL